MTPRNRKTLEARFPEIKSLTKGVPSENLTIHVETMCGQNLYRVFSRARESVQIYDDSRPDQAGISKETVYRTNRTDNGWGLDPTFINGRMGEFFRHIADIDTPWQRIVVCKATFWFETTEKQLPLESGRRTGIDVRIDVFLPPKGGIGSLLEETDVSKNVRLSGEILDVLNMNALGLPNARFKTDAHQLIRAFERVGEIAHDFQFGAYLRGLRETVEVAAEKSCGEVGEFKIACHRTGVCVTVEIRKGNSVVELAGSVWDDDPKFSVVGGNFTLDEGTAIVRGFVAEWKKLYRPLPQPAMFGKLRPMDLAPMA